MLPLHDRTRRQVCLAAFFLLCLLPTALVAVWGLARHWPGYVGAEARRLSRQLGLDVALDGVQYLRPGVVLYEGLKLTDPETGRAVLSCRVLEVASTTLSDAQGRRKPTVVLIASQPELQADGFERLWQLVRQPLQCERGAAEVDVRLSAADVTLKTALVAETLNDVRGSIESLPGGAQAEVYLRLAGVAMREPARIRLVRNRQTTPPASGFELDTGGGSLPCSLLGMGLAELRPLGAQSRFRGYIWANETFDCPAAGWDGEVTGQLLDVDLGRLVSDRFPHRLTGTAQVTIQTARFHRGRLEEGACTLSAGPGVIGRSLLEAAAGNLGLAKGAEPSTSAELVPYRQLALAAVLDANGLRLHGRCPAKTAGAILVDREHCLLGEPLLQPQPAVALIQALVPANEVQVPATRQTDWLMRHLPLPRIVAPAGSGSAAGQARLRLGRDVER